MNVKPAIPSLLFVSALICGHISAQGLRPPPPPVGQQREGNQGATNVEQYLKQLNLVRIEHIKLRLSVPDERAHTIADKWAELEAPIRRLNTESMAVWRKMQFIIQEASPEREKSRKIKPLHDQYRELRKELAEARHRLYHELPMMGSTPIQQARIIFLIEEMERKERDGLRTQFDRRRSQREHEHEPEIN